MNETKRPKCGGEMEEGTFTTQGSRWVGSGLIKVAASLAFVGKFVRAFRCKSCGFLESYAK